MSRITFKPVKSVSVELCSNKKLDLNSLSILNPSFYSVTFHDHASETYDNLNDNSAIKLATTLTERAQNVLLHLPCRYLTKETVLDILTIAKQNNILNILALQGEYVESKQSSDFKYAIDLIRFIKEKFPNTFFVGVTGYPANTIQSMSNDLLYLKQKIEAGADFIITQAIFEVDTFQNFYKSCRQADISVPIIPGVYIINTYNELLLMSKICKINVPEHMLKAVQSIKDNDETVKNYGLQYASELIHNLFTDKDCCVDNVHIFSLNNIENVHSVCKLIKLLD